MKKFAFNATTIANLFTPETWIGGVAELQVDVPSFLNTGALVTSTEMVMLASLGGVEIDIPFLQEPDIDDEIQGEDTDASISSFGSGLQKAAILNRQSAVGIEALAKAVATLANKPGVTINDPLGFVLGVWSGIRLRQWGKVALHQARGVFGAGGGAFDALRIANFIEDGDAAGANQLIDSDMIVDALVPLGAKKAKLIGGAMVIHSVIEAALIKQDEITVVRNSDGEIILRDYKGIPVYIDDTLVRNGTTSGKVYETYFFAPGAFAMGAKPQSSTIGDAASFVIDGDASKNKQIIYDRNRLIIHPQGARWSAQGGVPAGQSATNVELADEGNWQLALNDIRNVGMVQLLTNG